MFYPTKYAEDPTVRPFGSAIQNQNDLIKSLLIEVADQGEKIPISKTNKVSLMSLFRLRESLDSILLLTLNGYVRDASVLLLTLIELKLDVKYIGCNEERAGHWIKNLYVRTKPWKVAQLISKLYPKSSELDALKDIYGIFSAIKHANPAAGTRSFPLGVTGNWLAFEDDENISDLISVTLFVAGSEGYEIVSAAIETFVSRGFYLKTFKEAIATSQNNFKQLNSEHIGKMLNVLLKRHKKRQY